MAQVQPGPHWHCEPQAQAGCAVACEAGWAAACWQPQVQAAPGQVLQLQEVWFVVSFMVVSLVGCIDDGMSSMAALSALESCSHRPMRPAVRSRAGTVAQIDRVVAALPP